MSNTTTPGRATRQLPADVRRLPHQSRIVPHAAQIDFGYNTATDNAINRPDSIKDDKSGNPTELANYSYLGLGTVVQEKLFGPERAEARARLHGHKPQLQRAQPVQPGGQPGLEAERRRRGRVPVRL